jgi:hypothetical protein
MAKRNKWRTKEAVEIALKAGMEALMTGGEKIITEATNNVPIETGTLRRSATVSPGGLPNSQQIYEAAMAGQTTKFSLDKPLGKEKAVYVSYNTPYARRQHEELGYRHPLGGGPKYLENSFNQLKGKIKRLAELRIKKALRDER